MSGPSRQGRAGVTPRDPRRGGGGPVSSVDGLTDGQRTLLAALATHAQAHPAALTALLAWDREDIEAMAEAGAALERYLARGDDGCDPDLLGTLNLAGDLSRLALTRPVAGLTRALPFVRTGADAVGLARACRSLAAELEPLFAPDLAFSPGGCSVSRARSRREFPGLAAWDDRWGHLAGFATLAEAEVRGWTGEDLADVHRRALEALEDALGLMRAMPRIREEKNEKKRRKLEIELSAWEKRTQDITRVERAINAERARRAGGDR